MSASYSDGRLVRNSEGALWTSKDSSKDKIDRDNTVLLRHQYRKSGQPSKARVSSNSPCGLMFHVLNATLREVTENEKISSETYKTMSLIGKITKNLPLVSDGMN